MLQKKWKIIMGIAGLLICTACTQGAVDFAQISGYDAQGARTGSVLPGPYTLTSY